MQCLEMFNRNPKDFLRRFLTAGETWVHHYTAKPSNSQSNGLRLGKECKIRSKPFFRRCKLFFGRPKE